MNELIESMIRSAKQALPRAYAPYSKYQVACCLRSEDGSLFTAVNTENASYGLSICAESSAICQMVAAGQRKISSLVLLDGINSLCAPCGACRQRIAEFSTQDTLIHLSQDDVISKSFSIDELLPLQFKFTP